MQFRILWLNLLQVNVAAPSTLPDPGVGTEANRKIFSAPHLELLITQKSSFVRLAEL